MNRRSFIAVAGIGSLTGCTSLLSHEEHADTETMDLSSETEDGVEIYSDRQKLGHFAVRIWGGVPYEFRLSAQTEDDYHWHECMVEFTFPDDIRPPDIFLRATHGLPMKSFHRRNTDEFTVLIINEPVGRFVPQFRAEPLGSASDRPAEISMVVKFAGTLEADSIRTRQYHVEGSVPSTLLKSHE